MRGGVTYEEALVIRSIVVSAGIAAALAFTLQGEAEPDPLPDDLVLGRVGTLTF